MSQTGKCHPRSIRKKESAMTITRIGLDLAKNVFQVFGVDAHDKRVLSRRSSWGDANLLPGLAPRA